jgi:RNA recognition motif-containing protein
MKRASPSSPAERGGAITKKPRAVGAPQGAIAGTVRPAHIGPSSASQAPQTALGSDPQQHQQHQHQHQQYLQGGGEYSGQQGYDTSGYGTYDYGYYDGNYDMTYSTVGYYGQGVYDSMYGQAAQPGAQSHVSSYYGSAVGSNAPGKGGNMYNGNVQQQQQQSPTGYNMYNGMNPAGMNAGSGACRTVWIGNLPLGVTVEQLLDQVHFGALESVKIVPEKSCAFLTFLNANDAAAFHQHCQMHRFHIQNIDLNVRWGKSTAGAGAALPPNIQLAVANGASRNVYISGVPQGTTDIEVRNDLEQFGELDNIRIVPPREGHKAAICFVHFCSIASAMKCVTTLSQMNPKYAGRRVSYGKDRCIRRPPQNAFPGQPGFQQRHQRNYGQNHGMQSMYLSYMTFTYEFS